jgi:predicted O-linked N-acetylglucosamine transferase (SPINDLY family)
MNRKSRSRNHPRSAASKPPERLREIARVAISRGDLNAAEVAYRRAIELGMKDADVYNNLATIYDRRGGNPEEEAELLRKAHALAPDSGEIRNNRLNFLRREYGKLTKEERYREALCLARERLGLEPESAVAHRDLGFCYWKTGSLEDAVKSFTRAINLEPNNATLYNDFGLVCYDMRLLAEAQGAFQEVLRLSPNSIVAYIHLGLLANMTGLTGLAISFLERALAVDPNCSQAQNNIALFLRDQGEQERCRHHYQEALRLRPDSTLILSGYLLALNDDPCADPAWVAAEHCRFDKVVKGPRRVFRSTPLDGGRKLRVAYLSPDFRTHSVSFFVAPLFQQHDRGEVEIVAYYTGNVEDAISERIKNSVDQFHAVYRMSDDDLAKRIDQDGIDIIVELTGHTAENRLAMLARRVAPVQMSYLGYPNTTGLAEMDYRITDALADPPGLTDAWHTEKLARIEGGFLAYAPSEAAKGLPVADSPAATAGHVTFGSFNNLAKINDVVLDTWAAILEGLPTANLLVKARGLRNDKVKDRIMAAFTARGIDAEARVHLMGHERSAIDHLCTYHQIDIALDTFPYNGTTTTCEALWMGTPVLTFEGQSHAGRVGTSILTHAGLPDLVAKDRQDYIQRAVTLGQDLELIARLRRGLRERFAGSAVMDAARLARGLEKAYREAWQAYCASLAA